MKLNKLVAAFSALTMLGSLAVAVPASAAENVKIYPDEGLHVRANNTTGFGKYETLDVSDTASDATTQYEMQWGTTYFAAIYKYDISSYLNDTDVTITVYTGDNAYSVMPYTKMPANTADDVAAFKAFVDDNIASASTGAKTLTLTWSDLKTIADDNNGKVCLIFTRNNEKKWQKYIDMASTPYMTINSTPGTAEPVEPEIPEGSVAAYVSGGEKKYAADLATAYTEADADSEITILDDVQLNARLNVEKNLTIKGDGTKTITAKSGQIAILAKANLTIDGVNVAANGNNALQVEGTKTLTVKNSAVTGKVRQGNGNNSVINLDNVTVNGVVETRRGADVKTTSGSYCTVNLTNSSTANEVIYYSEPDTSNKCDAVNVDGTSSATLSDKYVAPTPVAPTGSFEKIYSSDGKDVEGEASAFKFTVTANDASGKVVLSVDGATVANSDTEIMSGSAVFGVLVNKDVDASVFSATLGGVAIVID